MSFGWHPTSSFCNLEWNSYSSLITEVWAPCLSLLQYLPTVIVQDFEEDLTPELLEREYDRIMTTPLSYWKWEHLTQVGLGQ